LTVAIREQPESTKCPWGNTVGFQDSERRRVRLTEKSVTLHCHRQNWRVGYGLLHRLIDADSSAGSMTPRT